MFDASNPILYGNLSMGLEVFQGSTASPGGIAFSRCRTSPRSIGRSSGENAILEDDSGLTNCNKILEGRIDDERQ